MTIIESIRDFIQTCPFLDEFSKAVNVNYMDDDAVNYMIEPTPVNPIVKKYMGGSSVRQFAFVFASREYYGPDTIENISNSGFYERFADWLEQSTLQGKLPVLDDKKTPRKIFAETTGYVYNADETLAQYQIQCKLTYFQERMI